MMAAVIECWMLECVCVCVCVGVCGCVWERERERECARLAITYFSVTNWRDREKSMYFKNLILALDPAIGNSFLFQLWGSF